MLATELKLDSLWGTGLFSRANYYYWQAPLCGTKTDQNVEEWFFERIIWTKPLPVEVSFKKSYILQPLIWGPIVAWKDTVFPWQFRWVSTARTAAWHVVVLAVETVILWIMRGVVFEMSWKLHWIFKVNCFYKLSDWIICKGRFGNGISLHLHRCRMWSCT